ncbi:hypothetical protein [Nitratifractor salsuginis]|uniref:Uncharacterized protein n=1 Tax=Nitratifractor salsuginis (strain DSM 16511 / JCM 12458 / E9I37-1) TaxID=749222 RepID=E6WYZ5_NITSE|nr:hypothetical protein [Nitratifractor salsuginis]ADV46581.1 hypothetical protein Nitsa_1330 [Nitratifractor salsuginis DSM 16511]
MTRLILILPFLSLTINAGEADPRIARIRKIFRQIEAQVKDQAFLYKKKERYDGYEVSQAVIYIDEKGRVRKLHCEGGTEDSAGSGDYYFRKDGTIFFSFVRGGSVHGCESEVRSYFDSTGRLIKRLRKDGKQCPAMWFYPLKIGDPERAYANCCFRN